VAVIRALLICFAFISLIVLVGILHSLPFAYAAGFLTCVAGVWYLRKHGWPGK
jgi:hypothetical protein